MCVAPPPPVCICIIRDADADAAAAVAYGPGVFPAPRYTPHATRHRTFPETVKCVVYGVLSLAVCGEREREPWCSTHLFGRPARGVEVLIMFNYHGVVDNGGDSDVVDLLNSADYYNFIRSCASICFWCFLLE